MLHEGGLARGGISDKCYEVLQDKRVNTCRNGLFDFVEPLQNNAVPLQTQIQTPPVQIPPLETPDKGL